MYAGFRVETGQKIANWNAIDDVSEHRYSPRCGQRPGRRSAIG